MSPNVLRVILTARDLVVSGWTQQDFAVDAHGRSVHPESLDAVAWDLTGALLAAGSRVADLGPRGPQLGVDAIIYVQGVLGDCTHAWNSKPGRTWVEVIELLERAARAVEAA